LKDSNWRLKYPAKSHEKSLNLSTDDLNLNDYYTAIVADEEAELAAAVAAAAASQTSVKAAHSNYHHVEEFDDRRFLEYKQRQLEERTRQSEQYKINYGSSSRKQSEQIQTQIESQQHHLNSNNYDCFYSELHHHVPSQFYDDYHCECDTADGNSHHHHQYHRGSTSSSAGANSFSLAASSDASSGRAEIIVPVIFPAGHRSNQQTPPITVPTYVNVVPTPQPKQHILESTTIKVQDFFYKLNI
jgi:hypothetical protein